MLVKCNDNSSCHGGHVRLRIFSLLKEASSRIYDLTSLVSSLPSFLLMTLVLIILCSSRCPAKSPKAFRNAIVLEAALEHRALRLLMRVEGGLAKDVKAGTTPSEAWNRGLVEVQMGQHSY